MATIIKSITIHCIALSINLPNCPLYIATIKATWWLEQGWNRSQLGNFDSRGLASIQVKQY